MPRRADQRMWSTAAVALLTIGAPAHAQTDGSLQLPPAGQSSAGDPLAPPPAAATPQTDPSAPAVQPLLLPSSRRPSDDTDPYLTLPIGDQPDALLARERQPRRDGSGFAPRGTTVLLRPRPLYDPIGIQTADFTIFPQLTLGTTVDTNIYNTPDGVTDLFGTLRGDLLARSNWSRNQLTGEAFVQQNSYIGHATENNTTYNVQASGRLDVGAQSNISGSVEYGRLHRSRSSLTEMMNLLGPELYRRARAELAGSTVAGNITLQAAATYLRTVYEDRLVSSSGATLPEATRDNNDYGVNVQVGYTLTPARRVVLTLSHDWIRYPTPTTPRRDTDYTEVLLGLESELTPLIRGRLSFGYSVADFADPALASRSGLAVDANLDYLVTELTTVHFEAQRRFDNAANAASPGAFVTSVRLSADHEYLRNLILSPGLLYQHADYVDDTESSGSFYGGDFTARWLLSRTQRVTARAAYRNRERAFVDSSLRGSGVDFSLSYTLQR